MGPILLRPNYISPVWSGPRINEARGLEADVAGLHGVREVAA